MNIIEIDARIRARIKELTDGIAGVDGLGENELDVIYMNYLPSSADSAWWNRVTDFVTEICGSGGGADGRPGRLYELSDEAIIEAQKWLDHCDEGLWRHVMNCHHLGEFPDKWSPGQTIQVEQDYTKERYTIPTAVFSYFAAAFVE